MAFKPIEKPSKPIKVLIAGPTGAGKTYTSLEIAQALVPEGKEIALLDTENGRASLMAAKFKFQYDLLSGTYSPARYVTAINEAVRAGFGVLIIDSVTHAWDGPGGLLDQVHANEKDTFTKGWRNASPVQADFVEAIMACPIPIICTGRSKMEYVLETNDKGKQVPRAVGLKPIQRDDFAYNLDFILNISMDHSSEVAKMPPIDGLGIEIPPDGYADWFKKVQDWMSTGVAVQPTLRQLYSVIKATIDPKDAHRIALLRQMYEKLVPAADAREIINAEPPFGGPVATAPAAPAPVTPAVDPVSEALVEPPADKPPVVIEKKADDKKEVVDPHEAEDAKMDWGKVMTFCDTADATQVAPYRGVLKAAAKAIKSKEDGTPAKAMKAVRALIADRAAKNGHAVPA